jgi:hypothetical protein
LAAIYVFWRFALAAIFVSRKIGVVLLISWIVAVRIWTFGVAAIFL